jgi:hypothetical protein
MPKLRAGKPAVGERSMCGEAVPEGIVERMEVNMRA